MFLGGLTIAINGFTMVFRCCYHRFQWFLMVPDHWSNDAMVSMDRCGLTREEADMTLSLFFSKSVTSSPKVIQNMGNGQKHLKYGFGQLHDTFEVFLEKMGWGSCQPPPWSCPLCCPCRAQCTCLPQCSPKSENSPEIQ